MYIVLSIRIDFALNHILHVYQESLNLLNPSQIPNARWHTVTIFDFPLVLIWDGLYID